MSGRTQKSLKRFLRATTLVLVACALARAEDDWKRKLGREDHIAYIVLDDLRSGRDTPQIFPADFNLGLSTFYEEFRWRPDTCWAGSLLREGVSAYCLPYARLGQYYPNARNPSEKIFSCMGSCAGLYVWYIPKENHFYLWATCWNVAGVLGPFIGDPRIELSQAVKPRRGSRIFTGVTLTMVSQRWSYPNAEDARVPRDDEYYDCSHGHMSGRAREMLALNSFITRLRLANHGAMPIYYQTESPSSDKPANCQLLSDRSKGWEHTLKVDYQCDIGGDSWRRLAPGEWIEWETQDQAFAQGTTGFIALLNDEPHYWDVSKLLATYPVMFGRH